MITRLYIVAAKRTAIGTFQGSLSTLSAVELGITVAKAAIGQSGIDRDDIDEVITGNVLGAGSGMGIGRQIAIGAGLSEDIPAYTLNMICGSGMKAVLEACAHIKAGDADAILAIGTESMSNAGFVLPGTLRRGHKTGHIDNKDLILCDGLTDAFHHYHMGITAENIARQYRISRETQDHFALASQQKAQAAQEKGLFDAEIVPVEIKRRRETIQFSDDEHIRSGISLDRLSSLAPAFCEHGSVTAGNASGLNDGASAILVVSEEFLERHELVPLAEIISYGQGGVAPEVMGLGPVPAIARALERSEYRLSNIERMELNEAFAAQSIGVLQELAQQHECQYAELEAITNPTGGAIALGHPIGCSGNRIITTLLYGLRRDRQSIGLASLCIGGGMGCAILIRAIHD